jgi:CRP/FNR family transcriptional regulator, cyclic AMP receptor protein
MLSLEHPAVLAFPSDVRAFLTPHITARTLEHHQHLHRRGETAEAFFWIAGGAIKANRKTAARDEVLLSFVPPGVWFGVFQGAQPSLTKRQYNMTAVGQTRVFELPGSTLAAAREQSPALSHRLGEWQARKIARLTTLLDESLSASLSTRAARRLLELVEWYAKPLVANDHNNTALRLELPITQQEIAAMLGVTRQRVNMLLASWAQLGIVAINYRDLVVHDLPLLAQLAGA